MEGWCKPFGGGGLKAGCCGHDVSEGRCVSCDLYSSIQNARRLQVAISACLVVCHLPAALGMPSPHARSRQIPPFPGTEAARDGSSSMCRVSTDSTTFASHMAAAPPQISQASAGAGVPPAPAVSSQLNQRSAPTEQRRRPRWILDTHCRRVGNGRRLSFNLAVKLPYLSQNRCHSYRVSGSSTCR